MERLVVVLAAVVAAGLLGVWFGVAALRRTLEARLSAADSEVRRLADSATYRDRGTEDLRREVTSFRSAFDKLRVREEERRAREEQGWAVLQRVSAVLTGSQKTGRVGENVLREALAHLPPSMLVRDFQVNGRVVEFGLVMPDGRRLPLDSKWPAERELAALAACTDAVERERLARVVERTVVIRAKEVAGYLDPSVTAPVAVAAVPDAAYAVLRRAHADAYRLRVVVVPYSMALPVVLFLYTLAGRFGSSGDVEACLAELESVLATVESVLENKVARAATMLSNGTEELRGQVGKARTSLSRARSGADPPLSVVPPVRQVEAARPSPGLAGDGDGPDGLFDPDPAALTGRSV